MLPRVLFPHKLGGLVFALSAVLATALLITTSGPGTSRANAAAATQTWADDFNGAADTAPDASKWTLETGGSGNGNNELRHCASPDVQPPDPLTPESPGPACHATPDAAPGPSAIAASTRSSTVCRALCQARLVFWLSKT